MGSRRFLAAKSVERATRGDEKADETPRDATSETLKSFLSFTFLP